MSRKRRWEVGAGAALLVVLVGIGWACLYVRHLNEALAVAFANGDGELAFTLLRRGATDVRVGAVAATDREPVFVAIDSRDPAFVQAVLTRGAKANTRRVDGYTALMRASAAGFVPAVRMLLERGAGISATDESGLTALHYAAGSNEPEAVRLLAASGADLNAQDSTGRTPLMIAAKFAWPEATRALLACGADPRLRNRAGNTALALARMKNVGRGPESDPRRTISLLEAVVAKKQP
jgi:hypothetical protein